MIKNQFTDKKTGVFDEELAANYYEELVRDQNLIEEYAKPWEKALIGLGYKVRGFVGGITGKTFEQLAHEMRTGKTWDQGRISVKEQRARGAGDVAIDYGARQEKYGTRPLTGQEDTQPATPVPKPVTQGVTHVADFTSLLDREMEVQQVPQEQRATVRNLLMGAAQERDGYLRDLQEIAPELGLGYKPELEKHAIKGYNPEKGTLSLGRVSEKIGQGRTVTDPLRATLFLPQDTAPQSQEYMQRTVDSMKARRYEVYVEDGKEDITDRFLAPDSNWYQDVAIKFTKNGVTRELLLLQENMWRAKMGLGMKYMKGCESEA